MRPSRRDALRMAAAGAAWLAAGCRRLPPAIGAVAGAEAVAGAGAVSAEPLPAWTIPDGLRRPGGLAFTADGGLMLAESGRHRLRRFGPDGALVATYGRCGTGLGEWNDPAGLVSTDVAGTPPPVGEVADDWFVADRGNARIVQVSKDGVAVGSVGTLGVDDHELLGPSGLAVGPVGSDLPTRMLLVADSRNRRVTVLENASTPRAFLWDGNVAEPVIRRPDDVAMFGRQLVAVADSLAGEVRAVQLVVTDVRVAFAEPGMAEIPAAGRWRGLRLGGFGGAIRLATIPLAAVRSDVLERPEHFGPVLLVAHSQGVTLCGERLEILGRLPLGLLGATGAIRPGGIAWDDARSTLAVSDAATGSILRARVRFA